MTDEKWDEQVLGGGGCSHEEPGAAPHRGSPTQTGQGGDDVGIDLGDVWSHYGTLNQGGEVIDRCRFRTTPKAIEKWFTDVPHARVAMEAGTPLDLDQRTTAGAWP